MKLVFWFSLLCCFVFISPANGQITEDGFLITYKGDTIPGQLSDVRKEVNASSILFYNASGEKEYSANDIQFIHYKDTRFFRSDIIRGKFVQEIIKGKITLYRLGSRFFTEKGNSFEELLSGQRELHLAGEIKVKQAYKFRGQMRVLVTDCLGEDKLLSILLLTEPSLVRLIDKYNKCSKEYEKPKIEDRQFVRVRAGFYVGALQNSISVLKRDQNFYFLSDSYQYQSFQWGGTLNLLSPRFSKRLLLSFEPFGFDANYESFETTDISRGLSYDLIKFEYRTFSFPINLRIHLSKKTEGLYFQGGIAFNKITGTSSFRQNEVLDNQVVYTHLIDSPLRFQEEQSGYSFGVGYSKAIKPIVVSINGRYSHYTKINENFSYAATPTVYSLNLSITNK